MILSGHIGYVTAAYLLSLVTIIGLVVWVWADYRTQLKKLADLEARGIVRRSRSNDSAN